MPRKLTHAVKGATTLSGTTRGKVPEVCLPERIGGTGVEYGVATQGHALLRLPWTALWCKGLEQEQENVHEAQGSSHSKTTAFMMSTCPQTRTLRPKIARASEEVFRETCESR